MNLQSIVSRNVEITEGAAVVTVGSFHGGIRNNIISDDVELLGTIRTHNSEAKQLIHQRVVEIAENTAASFGATAKVELDILYPVTVNHPEICRMMFPALEKAAGRENVNQINPVMGAEDFSFFLNESALKTGVRAFSYMVLEYSKHSIFSL